MIQENGMPEGAPIIYGEDFILKAWKLEWDDNGELKDVWTNESRDIYRPEEVKISYPIGATDSSDPKQELYLGDLIEFNLDKKDVVGLIVWKSFQVWVKIQKHENWATYLGMSHVLDYFKIKKLGSSYDPKMKEILEKVGLEKW